MVLIWMWLGGQSPWHWLHRWCVTLGSFGVGDVNNCDYTLGWKIISQYDQSCSAINLFTVWRVLGSCTPYKGGHTVTSQSCLHTLQIFLVQCSLVTFSIFLRTVVVIYCHLKLSVGQTPRSYNLPSKSLWTDVDGVCALDLRYLGL